MDGAAVCRTSSRASRRPPDVISTVAILDPRWRGRKWRHPGPGARFSTPIVAVAQDGGPSASGRHLGWPHLWEPEMRSSKMAAGSGRAAILRHHHNRGRKTRPILLVYFPVMKNYSLSLASKRFSISIYGSHVANFGHTACYRHSTLTAPCRNVAWCLLRQRTASKGASKHYGTQQTKRFNLLITGEEASNTDPQLTVHHLKQTFVQAINPSIAYLLHICQKNPIYFPPVVPRGFSVGFRIGMLSTARWVEMLQGAKKRGRNYTFRQILTKNRVEIQHFPPFCWNIGFETIQIF